MIHWRNTPIYARKMPSEKVPAPKVSLNPEVKDFYQFTTDDLIVEDYQTGPQIKNIPIAI